MNNENNIFTLAGMLGVITISGLFIWLILRVDKAPTKKHKELCMEYALRDHRGEIGEARFEWLSKRGDPNDVVFFYESCLGHVMNVPAEKKYMVESKGGDN